MSVQQLRHGWFLYVLDPSTQPSFAEVRVGGMLCCKQFCQ
ncbi:hypothetical protein SynA18461_00976 [Synechococcus sp. A18-46.1]|nr:hypothetical protein SynA18461_00976 [Synechococcus sp. A18-46.1]